MKRLRTPPPLTHSQPATAAYPSPLPASSPLELPTKRRTLASIGLSESRGGPTTIFRFMQSTSVPSAAARSETRAVSVSGVSAVALLPLLRTSDDLTIKIDDAQSDFAVWIKISADGGSVRVAAFEMADEDESRNEFFQVDANPDAVSTALARWLGVEQVPVRELLPQLAASTDAVGFWTWLMNDSGLPLARSITSL